MANAYLRLAAGTRMCTKLESSLGIVLMVQHVVAQDSGQIWPQSILAEVKLVQVDERSILV